MALLADRVKETTTTTGTGTVSLAGAPAGFQSFNTAFANGSLVYYVIQGGAEFEIGIGTTGTGTLARTQVLQSSNADALVPFSAGVKDVFCSYVADRAVTTVDAATLTNKTIDDYTNNIGANSTHFRIKATGTISKGSVVKATGYNPGEQAIEVAVVTSATDLVLGISEQALTTGQFGLAVVIGELFDVNTNGFTVGNIIYSNGSGGFTETKPSSGLYQALGWIVRANASNGVIAVNVVAPLYVETATNTANTSVLRDGSGNFAAGTITATLSGTATQVSNALTAGTYLTSGGTYNGSAARTFAVDATDANTASKVVARDASGNFSAGTITATLNGAAPAGSLSGNTLASGVTASSLTSVGTLSSLTVSGSSTFNSLITRTGSAATGTQGLLFNGTTTAFHYANFANTGGSFVLGVEGSAGNQLFSGSAAYSSGIKTGNATNLCFGTNDITRMTIDTSGNLGLGVTPSAWGTGSSIRALQLNAGALWNFSTSGLNLIQNGYYDGSNYKYVATAAASQYSQSAGAHSWYTAPSGTAGNAISFTQAMTLDANGYLAIGTTTTTSARVNIQNSDAINEVVFRGTEFTNILSETTGGMQIGISSTTGTAALAFLTANTERARITSGGDVGIGTASPAFALGSGLEVERAGIATLRLENSSGGNGLEIAADSTTNGIRFYGLNNAPFVFAPNASERMRIDNTSTAGQTALLLYDVDNNTVERVTVGAADSGGTGFKVLRIPN